MGPPTVSLSMRRERDNALSSADRSIGIAVQIPLGSKIRNRPAETQAATQLATAAAELSEARAALGMDAELARGQLADAAEAMKLAQERVAVMREHTALFEKAFKLGERGLADLLRSQTLAHEAQVAARQQEVALGLAHAQLNQALGILP
jgi:outer membrane protein TolC